MLTQGLRPGLFSSAPYGAEFYSLATFVCRVGCPCGAVSLAVFSSSTFEKFTGLHVTALLGGGVQDDAGGDAGV